MIRNHFTFYKNFYDSIQRLSKKDQADIILAICAYALYEEEPGGLSATAYTAFSLMKPAIDNGRNRSRAGALGGAVSTSKDEANRKQSASKTEAKCKQERREKKEEETIYTDSFSKREEDICSSVGFASSALADELYDKDAVKLTDAEAADLINNIGEEYFKYYADVVAKCERSGRRYTKKHYRAIADMAKKDGRWGRTVVPTAESPQKSNPSSFQSDAFWEAAIARTEKIFEQMADSEKNGEK